MLALGWVTGADGRMAQYLESMSTKLLIYRTSYITKSKLAVGLDLSTAGGAQLMTCRLHQQFPC